VFVIDATTDSTWAEANTSLLSLLSTMESLDIQRHVAVLLHKVDAETEGDMSPQYTELRRGLLDSSVPTRSNSRHLLCHFSLM
jgi:hypothetical protein